MWLATPKISITEKIEMSTKKGFSEGEARGLKTWAPVINKRLADAKKGAEATEFAPVPNLSPQMTDDFRKRIVELLKQDNWAINRITEVLMIKRMENNDRISKIEKELKEEIQHAH